jgi:4-hydroxybenzoate polyprenyltransferase
LELILQPLIGLLRALRPKQWTKNAIIYAGLVFDGQLLIPDSFLRVTISFILLCLTSGVIYVVNDLVDVESDRQHPKKRNRPIASGQLPIPLAVGAVIGLSVFCVGTALLYSPKFAIILIVYMALHVAYSLRIKRIVILDVLAITAGYVLRVAGGVVVIEVARFSPWLYACTAMLALFLAIGKRRQELLELAEQAGDIRVTFKHYNLPLLDNMLQMSMIVTMISYILYTIEAPSVLLAGSNLALLTVPFVLYAIFRYMYLIHVKGEGSAPEEVLLKDRPLQASMLLWGLTFVAILYLPNLR